MATLEYDSENRIIKENIVLIEADGEPVNEPQDPVVFEYNEDGNLVHEYMSEYDDKISFFAHKPCFYVYSKKLQ